MNPCCCHYLCYMNMIHTYSHNHLTSSAGSMRRRRRRGSGSGRVVVVVGEAIAMVIVIVIVYVEVYGLWYVVVVCSSGSGCCCGRGSSGCSSPVYNSQNNPSSSRLNPFSHSLLSNYCHDAYFCVLLHRWYLQFFAPLFPSRYSGSIMVQVCCCLFHQFGYKPSGKGSVTMMLRLRLRKQALYLWWQQSQCCSHSLS